MIAVLLVLFIVFRKTGLNQRFLLSRVNLSLKDGAVESIAFYSIIPTFVAVGIKLWWESVDEVFRRLQPFVPVSRQKSLISTRLSYNTTPVGWVVGKAIKNHHWLLSMIAAGALLAQICTSHVLPCVSPLTV